MSGPPRKKQKQPSIAQSMLKTPDPQDSKVSLTKLYHNKRVLLKAKALYRGGKIPEGEEKHLFQYHVQQVNNDCKSFVLKFDRTYVEEGTHAFKMYPVTDPGEETMDDYRMVLFEDDHELYCEYLGKKKKEENDRRDEELKRRAALSKSDTSFNDVADIEKLMLTDLVNSYDVLTAEFESVGERVEHVSQGANNRGEVTYKQQWSQYPLLCHYYSEITFIPL